MKSLLQLIVIGACAVLSAAPTSAAVYSADANTSPSGTTRLYLNTSETTVAPSGSLLWFIADTTGGGVASLSGNVLLSTFQNIAADVGSLQLLGSGATPGNLGGFAQPGTASFTFSGINTSYANNNIYALLISDPDRNGAPDPGETFGVYKIGVAPPPQLGNAQWIIGQNMHGDQGTITAVPEPAAFGTVAGLLCLAGAIARRKLRK